MDCLTEKLYRSLDYLGTQKLPGVIFGSVGRFLAYSPLPGFNPRLSDFARVHANGKIDIDFALLEDVDLGEAVKCVDCISQGAIELEPKYLQNSSNEFHFTLGGEDISVERSKLPFLSIPVGYGCVSTLTLPGQFFMSAYRKRFRSKDIQPAVSMARDILKLGMQHEEPFPFAVDILRRHYFESPGLGYELTRGVYHILPQVLRDKLRVRERMQIQDATGDAEIECRDRIMREEEVFEL